MGFHFFVDVSCEKCLIWFLAGAIIYRIVSQPNINVRPIEGRRGMARKKLVKGLWSKDDLKQLKKLFPNRPTADVATDLGRPTEAVKKKASRMGLKKSKKYMKSLGRS